jgi:hypothetical protein
MTILILVRHARSAPSADLPEEAFPLSEAGRRQALELAPVLAELGVEVLASSPYQRAIDTLQPYADAARLPIAIDPELRERSLGGWLSEASQVEDAIARMHADPDYRLEGGESARECGARMQAAIGGCWPPTAAARSPRPRTARFSRTCWPRTTRACRSCSGARSATRTCSSSTVRTDCAGPVSARWTAAVSGAADPGAAQAP